MEASLFIRPDDPKLVVWPCPDIQWDLRCLDSETLTRDDADRLLRMVVCVVVANGLQTLARHAEYGAQLCGG